MSCSEDFALWWRFPIETGSRRMKEKTTNFFWFFSILTPGSSFKDGSRFFCSTVSSEFPPQLVRCSGPINILTSSWSQERRQEKLGKVKQRLRLFWLDLSRLSNRCLAMHILFTHVMLSNSYRTYLCLYFCCIEFYNEAYFVKCFVKLALFYRRCTTSRAI